jgi:hypothetical protein
VGTELLPPLQAENRSCVPDFLRSRAFAALPFRLLRQIGGNRSWIRSLAAKKGDRFLVSAANRFRQGSPPVVGPRVDLRPVRQEQLDEVDAA